MEVDGSGGRRRDLDLGGGIQSPSSSSLELAVATVIPNGERRDSERSCGGGTAMAATAADGDNLPGASAAIGGGGGDDDGRRGWTQTGKGRRAH